MAAEKKLVLKDEAPAAPPAVDYVCGLRKIGPSSYSVVTGRVVDGKAEDWKVDNVAQPIDFSAEGLKMAFKKLLGEIP